MKRYAPLVFSNVYWCCLYYRWDCSLQLMWRKRNDQCRKLSSQCCHSDRPLPLVDGTVNNAPLIWAKHHKHSNYQPSLMGSAGLWLRPAAWCIWGPVGFDCLISNECSSLLHIQSRHLFLLLFSSLSPCHLLKSSHRCLGPPSFCLFKI